MRDRLMTALVGVLAVGMMAGCSDTNPGTSSAGTTTPETSAGSEPSSGLPGRDGAPRVENPLDATKYLPRPCAAISPQLLPGLGLPAQGKLDTGSAVAKHAGPGCHWQNSETATGVRVAFMTGNKNGLADLYRGHGQGEFKGYWEESTVEGYPAVFASSTDSRPQGFCTLHVGISDALTVFVTEGGRLKERSCDHATQVAAAVVQTLKGEV